MAITRARKSLTLARFDGRHPLLDALPETPDVFHRAPTRLPQPTSELARRYQRIALRDVDIGFAGRHPPAHDIHRAIAAVAAGDTLFWGQEEERWLLVDHRGDAVGRLARAFIPPANMRCIEARVIAIIARAKEDVEPQYLNSVRCKRWEVVVPELVFEPGL